MAENVKILFNQGYVSSRDETELQNGELVSGVGSIYKHGDPTRIWKEQGRSSYFTVPDYTGPIDGLELLVFDEGKESLLDTDVSISGGIQDRLVSLVSGIMNYVSISTETPSSGIYSSPTSSGITSSSPNRLYRVHWNDIHYISNKDGRPYAIEVESATSGNVRRMGMLAPGDVPQLSFAGEATFSLTPTWVADAPYYYHRGDRLEGFIAYMNQFSYDYGNIFNGDPLKATDNDIETYAYGDISSSNRLRTMVYAGFPSNSGVNRKVFVRFQVTPKGATDPGDGDIGTGTSLGDNGVLVHIHAVYNATSYTPVLPHFEQNGSQNWFQYPEPFRTCDESALKAYDTNNETLGARMVYERYTLAHERPVTAQVDLPDNYDISGLQIYVSFGGASHGRDSWSEGISPSPPYYVSFTKTNDSTMRIYDVRVSDGSSQSVFGAPSGVRYCITEYDSERGLESIPGPQSDTLTFQDRPGTSITMPSGALNPTTTKWRVYRSNLPDGPPASGVDDGWNNFGLVGQVPYESGVSQTFTDEFREFTISQQPIPLVPTIQVDGDDQTTTFYLRDRTPVSMAGMTSFKGSIVGIDSVNPRTLRYSYAGFPESWPSFHVIDAIPLKEQDSLVGVSTISNALVILARGAILTTLELPHIRMGRLVASDIDVIEGAPGCVGPYAYTDILWNDFPALAYVSTHGVQITNGHSVNDISEDLDWDAEINESTLSSCALFYDRSYKVLYMHFDKDGDGKNDHYFIFHLSNMHRKNNGQPKVLGPTPGKISKFVGGLVSNSYRIFSGSSITQNIFEERNGTADASNSWAGGTNLMPWYVRTGRHYGDWNHWSVIRGNLRHTNWGDQNINIQWTAGRDDGDITQTVNKTVSVNGKRGHEFLVARNGEYHQVELQHVTSGNVGGVHHIMGKVTPHGPIGDN
jgi:hypothetical protein